MKTREIINSMETQRIVTRPMGSWKWQDAYAVSTLQAHEATDGRVIWKTVYTGPKRSEPQLRDIDVQWGSLHNRPVTQEQADALIGKNKRKWLESRGFTFKGRNI